MLPSDPASNQPFTLYLLHYRISGRQKLFRECGPKQDQPRVYHTGSSCWHAHHKWDGNNRLGQRGFTFTWGFNSRGLLLWKCWFSTSTLSSPVAISQHKSSSTLSSPCKTILLSRDPSSFMKKKCTHQTLLLALSPKGKEAHQSRERKKEKRFRGRRLSYFPSADRVSKKLWQQNNELK